MMEQKGLVASGMTSESLEVRGNQLLGDESIFYLDKGRGPGKFPPVDNIRQWVRQKLGLEDDGVAYLVGRKIATEGTEIYKDNSLGLELDRLIDEMLEELNKELPEAAAAEALKWL